MIRLFTYEEVEKAYPNITARMVRDAVGRPSGPRKFKPGVVSEHEIDAWIIREEKKQGVRN